MKVWNDNIKACVECSYCNMEDKVDYYNYHCNKMGGYIDKEWEIHNDCPFNQPIIEELFEELGCKRYNDINEISMMYRKGIYTLEYLPNNTLHIVFSANSNRCVFLGKIFNPEELKLILNRLEI